MMWVMIILGWVGSAFTLFFMEEGEGKEVSERCMGDGCVVLEGYVFDWDVFGLFMGGV